MVTARVKPGYDAGGRTLRPLLRQGEGNQPMTSMPPM